MSMDSTADGTAENGGKSMAGEILGTDSTHKKAEEVLCQRYGLQAGDIPYRIRPNDDKRPVLLPIGQAIQFRIRKHKLFFRDPEEEQTEREYTVVSMQLRDLGNQ